MIRPSTNSRLIRVITSMTCGILVSFALMASLSAQPRFGIEVGIGQSTGLTAYSDNVVYLDDTLPYLADEELDSGLALALMFVFDRLEVGVDIRWFARERLTVHHQGDDNIPSGRVRPDGTVDDSGISYSEISPLTINSSASRGDLFLGSLVAGYRLYFLTTDTFDLYVPFTGGLVMTHLLEANRPYEFGLQVSSGLGVSVEIASRVSLVGVGRLHGAATPSYGVQADASRTESSAGGGTISAAFDSFLYGSAVFGVQFKIR